MGDRGAEWAHLHFHQLTKTIFQQLRSAKRTLFSVLLSTISEYCDGVTMDDM